MPENKKTDWQETPALEKYGKRGRRFVTTDEGKKRQLPTLPYEEWCKVSGGVHRIPIMTTRNFREAQNAKAYMDMERRRQIRYGAFPWQYETAKDFSPSLVGERNEAQWHVERERLAAERKKEHKEQQMGGITSKEQIIGAAIEGNTEAVKELVKEMTSQFKKKGSQGVA